MPHCQSAAQLPYIDSRLMDCDTNLLRRSFKSATDTTSDARFIVVSLELRCTWFSLRCDVET